MVISIFISDARRELGSDTYDLADHVSHIVYAYYTLIVDQHKEVAETYIHCIRHQGLFYGLNFNLG